MNSRGDLDELVASQMNSRGYPDDSVGYQDE